MSSQVRTLSPQLTLQRLLMKLIVEKSGKKNYMTIFHRNTSNKFSFSKFRSEVTRNLKTYFKNEPID